MFCRYIGYSVNLKESKKDKQKEKRKANSSDAKAKNQTDGTELTDIKVEVSLNHTNQQLQVNGVMLLSLVVSGLNNFLEGLYA